MIPNISVVMPVYNEERFVERSIESILNQTFTDFEFIIIDDGSTDRTVEMVNSFTDDRITLFKSEKKGIVHQLNFGLKMSSTLIIARMDADDVSEERRFERQYNFLIENPAIDIVGTNFIRIDEWNKVIEYKKYPENHDDIKFMMPVESAVCHPTVLFRKKILENLTSYKAEYETVEDHELFLRLIESGRKFYNIQEPLYRYRSQQNSTTREKIKRQNALSYKIGKESLLKNFSLISSKSEKYNYYLRMGLIEYYRGSISNSRHYFFKAAVNKKLKILKILRYLIVSILGQKNIVRLREKNILTRISLYVNKVFKLDLHRIRY